jgi:hypothetical protein
MTELTPESRAILDAARNAESPPPGAQRRIHAAILAGIATGAAEGTAAAATTAGGAAFGLKLLAPFVVAALGLGGAYVGGAFDTTPTPTLPRTAG